MCVHCLPVPLTIFGAVAAAALQHWPDTYLHPLPLRSTLWNNPNLTGCLPVAWADKSNSGKGELNAGWVTGWVANKHMYTACPFPARCHLQPATPSACSPGYLTDAALSLLALLLLP